MRKHVNMEVAFEILSMYLSIALQEKNVDEIKKTEQLKRRLYQGDKEALDIVLNEYGSKVKRAMEG